MTRPVSACLLTFGLLFGLPSFADLVKVADPTTAESLPGGALDLTGDPGVTEITGSLDNTNPDLAALFKIDIINPRFFSASTVDSGAFGIPDAALFLFNASGNGVYENDDISSSNTQACLPSREAAGTSCNPAITGLGPLSPGVYFLAVTLGGNGPIDALSKEIFSPVLSTDVVGPNAGVGPIAGWDQQYFASPDTDNIHYDILISDSPEPAAWPMTLALGLGLVLFRRRLQTH